MLRIVLCCVCLFALTGCDRECVGSAPDTIAAFVPPGLRVNCVDARSFEVEGRTVRLTSIEYGVLQDCDSGCFSSHVCAIEDPNVPEPLLFWAGWSAVGEAPVGLEAECPSLDPNTFSGETYPDCKPSGVDHPLVSTPAFQAFAEAEFGNGPLRFCVTRWWDTAYWLE